MAFFGLLGLDESRAFGLTNPPPNPRLGRFGLPTRIRGVVGLRRRNPPIVKRRGDEYRIDSAASELLDVFGSTDASSRDDLQLRLARSEVSTDGRADLARTVPSADAIQVEHDDSLEPDFERHFGRVAGRSRPRLRGERRLSPEIEAEDQSRTDHLRHGRQRFRSIDGLQPGDRIDALVHEAPRVSGRPHATVHEEIEPIGPERTDRRPVGRALHDRVEIGDVEPLRLETPTKRARDAERGRVRGDSTLDRTVSVALTADPPHDDSPHQIDHRKDARVARLVTHGIDPGPRSATGPFAGRKLRLGSSSEL